MSKSNPLVRDTRVYHPPQLDEAQFGLPILQQQIVAILASNSERQRYEPLASLANEVLDKIYERHPPSCDCPAVRFVATRGKVTRGQAKLEPNLFVVYRDLVDETTNSTTAAASGRSESKPKFSGIRLAWRLIAVPIELKTGRKSASSEISATSYSTTSSSNSSQISGSKKRDRELASLDEGEGDWGGQPSQSPKQPRYTSQPTGSPTSRSALQKIPTPTFNDTIPPPGAGYMAETMRTGGMASNHLTPVMYFPVDLAPPLGRTLPLEEDLAKAFVAWVTAVAGAVPPSQSLERWLQDKTKGNLGSLQLGKPLRLPSGVSGRCTTVYAAKIVDANNLSRDVAVKVTFPPKTRQKEIDLIAAAREVNTARDHVPEILASWIEDVQPIFLSLYKPFSDDSKSEQREKRVTIMPLYRHLDELTGDEFLELFQQLMQCVFDLRNKAHIHHQDLSLENCMYALPQNLGDQKRAILADFDLARQGPSDGPTSRHRSGAPLFMARSLLYAADEEANGILPKISEEEVPSVEQTLAEIMESALWVLLVVSLGYKEGRPLPTNDPLQDWRRASSYGELADRKAAFLGTLPHSRNYRLFYIRPEYTVLRKPIEEIVSLIQNWELRALVSSPSGSNSHLDEGQFFQCFVTDRKDMSGSQT